MSEELLTPAQIAERWQVHISSVYRVIREGTLPAVRIMGRTYRIKAEDAERAMRPVRA